MNMVAGDLLMRRVSVPEAAQPGTEQCLIRSRISCSASPFRLSTHLMRLLAGFIFPSIQLLYRAQYNTGHTSTCHLMVVISGSAEPGLRNQYSHECSIVLHATQLITESAMHAYFWQKLSG